MGPRYVELSDAAVERIAQRFAAVLREGTLLNPGSPVIPLADAIKFVFQGKRSSSAFYRWCREYHVRPCSAGRYAVSDLQGGLVREAKGVYQHNRKRESAGTVAALTPSSPA